jgi:hypothetical protein
VSTTPGGKFAASVVDTGGNLPPASMTPAENLPPVSTTQAELVAKFSADVNNTSGTGGKICRQCP